MRRLEAVYLANVVLYVRSIETIIKLIQVNKKCQEATKIIRYYNSKTLFENEDVNQNNHYFTNKLFDIFDLFPNTETIKCKTHDILNNYEFFLKVKQIELTIDGPELPQQIKDKIIKLEKCVLGTASIELNEFPKAQKVKLYKRRRENLKDILGNINIKLKQVIIRTEDSEELNYLKDYRNIENKIILLTSRITKERFEELKSFAKVYSIYPIEGFEFEDSFGYDGFLILISEYDIEKLYQLTLFTKYLSSDDFDLRNCKFLEGVIGSRNTSIQIKGLTHLKRIKDVGHVDFIPPSVTYLSYNSFYDYTDIIENESGFCNVKEIKIDITYHKNLNQYATSLKNFNGCEKLELFCDDGVEKCETFQLPKNLKELIINTSVNKDQLIEISKLTGLKKLSIRINHKHKENYQEMFDKLKQLEWLNIYNANGILLPKTLTYLEFDLNDDVDLSQHTNLKEIIINGYCNNIDIKLPNKLNKLYIQHNFKVKVTNSNEIEVNTIVFNNSNFEISEWKSKNIYFNECKLINNI